MSLALLIEEPSPQLDSALDLLEQADATIVAMEGDRATAYAKHAKSSSVQLTAKALSSVGWLHSTTHSLCWLVGRLDQSTVFNILVLKLYSQN